MPASAVTRIKAFMLDYVLMFAYFMLLAAVGSFMTLGPFADAWNALLASPWRMDLVAFLTTVLPVTLYFAFSEAAPRGATWGKRKMGIAVVGSDGRQIGLSHSFLRSALKFLPWQLAHTAMFHIPGFPIAPQQPPAWVNVLLLLSWLLVIVYMAGLFRIAGGRTLYDRIAGTRCETTNRIKGN